MMTFTDGASDCASIGQMLFFKNIAGNKCLPWSSIDARDRSQHWWVACGFSYYKQETIIEVLWKDDDVHTLRFSSDTCFLSVSRDSVKD